LIRLKWKIAALCNCFIGMRQSFTPSLDLEKLGEVKINEESKFLFNVWFKEIVKEKKK